MLAKRASLCGKTYPNMLEHLVSYTQGHFVARRGLFNHSVSSQINSPFQHFCSEPMQPCSQDHITSMFVGLSTNSVAKCFDEDPDPTNFLVREYALTVQPDSTSRLGFSRASS